MIYGKGLRQHSVINNRVRRILKTAIAEMSLFSDDRQIRLQAAQELGFAQK
jgi:hypothetical protein